MELVHIYEALADRTRIRILRLLSETPLCVCHLQEILGESQVKISKHLAYLRRRGLVEVRPEKNWMIYSLPAQPGKLLRIHLACLQECAHETKPFQGDLRALARLRTRREDPSVAAACC